MSDQSEGIFQPENDIRSAALEAKRLIEAYLDEKIVILRRVATERFDGASPFFWSTLDAHGGYHTLAMRYHHATNEWEVEPGTDQEWSFEAELGAGKYHSPAQRSTGQLLHESGEDPGLFLDSDDKLP